MSVKVVKTVCDQDGDVWLNPEWANDSVMVVSTEGDPAEVLAAVAKELGLKPKAFTAFWNCDQYERGWVMTEENEAPADMVDVRGLYWPTKEEPR